MDMLQSPVGDTTEISPNERESMALSALQQTVENFGTTLVRDFYDVLLQNNEAKAFLDHAVVQKRLSASMLNWLVHLLGTVDIRSDEAIQDQQRVIGEVHARIKIPIHLVMQGAAVIKSRIIDLLEELNLDQATTLAAVRIASIRTDTAIMLMSKAYVTDATARARLDEAYRLFSLDQDVAVEKEAQRAELLEWSHKTLFSLLRGEKKDGLRRLSDSSFGLWIRHRAHFMFERSNSFKDLVTEINNVDNQLLANLAGSLNPSEHLEHLAEFQAAVDRIAFLLNDLFQTLTTMENGRDPLTRALNRRFLPAILGREITFANESRRPLSIILMDVDHFKSINDQHGHQAGDMALRQVAQTVLENVRPSDFVFRYGGEEFLIILSETAVDHAIEIVERIRLELTKMSVDIGASDTIKVTASFGMAHHAGHPDQKYLIKLADDALYLAKKNGRNRIEISNI